MITFRRSLGIDLHRLWKFAIVLLLILLGGYIGLKRAWDWMVPAVGALGMLALLQTPQWGLLGLIGAALIVPLEFDTGTDVKLNTATLLVPALFAVWSLKHIRRSDAGWRRSRVNRPLILFLLSGLISLLIGNAFWDPGIPKGGNFWLAQLAQWAIFAFSALAFWLIANLQDAKTWLPRVTWSFLYLAGGLAILYTLPFTRWIVHRFATLAVVRASFWLLLTGVAAGQLIFSKGLSRGRKGFLVAVMAAVLFYAFVDQRDTASNWVGVTSVLGMLFWLRFPKLRIAIVVLTVLLAMGGALIPTLYDFAGGEDEWIESGGSRIALIERVVSVTLRNPITGLGPASYRHYADAQPLRYRDAMWFNPRVNSHNNYVDLFAHTGLLGLSLFLWFAIELGLIGWRLSQRYRDGFVGGYVNGILAVGVGSLVLMLLADWILPFVYNVGFPGFQASVLIWLFLGGLVVIHQEQWADA